MFAQQCSKKRSGQRGIGDEQNAPTRSALLLDSSAHLFDGPEHGAFDFHFERGSVDRAEALGAEHRDKFAPNVTEANLFPKRLFSRPPLGLVTPLDEVFGKLSLVGNAGPPGQFATDRSIKPGRTSHGADQTRAEHVERNVSDGWGNGIARLAWLARHGFKKEARMSFVPVALAGCAAASRLSTCNPATTLYPTGMD